MKKIELVRSAVLAVALAGAGALPAYAGDAKGDAAGQFAAAIEKAEEARKKAASVGGEWRDTGKVIKKAKAAAKSGDYGSAMQLANTAYRQGELGYKQALSQESASFPSYMR